MCSDSHQGHLLTTVPSLFLLFAAGAVLMAIAWPVNLGALGNSLAIWLGISPWQLFFYVFLPPLLLDAAVRIDWYLFKKVRACLWLLLLCTCAEACIPTQPVYQLAKWPHNCGCGAVCLPLLGILFRATNSCAVRLCLLPYL